MAGHRSQSGETIGTRRLLIWHLAGPTAAGTRCGTKVARGAAPPTEKVERVNCTRCLRLVAK